MVKKITISPKKVRGLGNIISKKSKREFLAHNCRNQTQQTTVNGVSKEVFMVDASPGTLTETYLNVLGPHIVYLTDETISFTVSMHKTSDDTKIKSNVKLNCLIGGELYTENVDSSTGNAVFTINNTFNEGDYTIRFTYDTIDSNRRAFCYKNWNFIVVSDGEPILNLISIKDTIQTDDTNQLIGKLTVNDIGIPRSTIYFFEKYIPDRLWLSLSKDVIKSGELATLSAELRDSDGSIITEDNTVYFFERYTPLSLRGPYSSSNGFVQNGVTTNLYANLRDEDGSAIIGETVSFYELYISTILDVHSSKNIFMKDDVVLLSAVLKDSDGSNIKGETVSFYELFVPKISISLSNNSVTPGDTITISATVLDNHGDGVENISVRFIGESEHGDEVIYTTQLTDSDGRASVTYAGDENGEIEVYAWVLGENVYSDTLVFYDA